MKRVQLIVLFFVSSLAAHSQVKSLLKAPLGWEHLDLEQDSVWGCSINKAYEFLKQFTPRQKVVVAIVDAGGDVNHEDLKNKLWVNKGEIPGDHIDNDKNGYIDDIHGWNFVGYPDGKQQVRGILEVNRELLRLKDRFLDADSTKLSKKEMKEYRYFRDVVMTKPGLPSTFRKVAETEQYLKYIPDFTAQLKEKCSNPDEVFRYAFSYKISPSDKGDKTAGNAFYFFESKLRGLPVSKWDSIVSQKENWKKEVRQEFEDACKTNQKYIDSLAIIDPHQTNLKERYYGNSNLYARGADHGTHVGGTIGAERNNGIGMNGIADAALMFVRILAYFEDETDKNVAAGIMYAVENGAKVINMSFGKYLTPHPELVYAAFRYAEKKGVLLVHAAGNDSRDVDTQVHYPYKKIAKKRAVRNVIEVGASTWEGQPSSFSNYGKNTVDVFAPGSDIYSTIPDNKYLPQSGTSMATPVVSGIAALIWTYFPDLSAEQMIDILKRSVVSRKGVQVMAPGGSVQGKSTIDFGELCSSGGIVNAYRAAQLAAEVSKGKK
ncbi:S8 family serine peptidase [Pseudobacter ginsenosidimutans]|uniref:Subtilase family protein n=1 Tax=Pseudobacter ginsenosidimutans TaxID=661488 RepID=A0A4Q7N2C2_9BACT|nr:S8 family serine peptidase [Pseudobacter ginsenosidimutans]QEC44042.1 S8 family serine peptidase [Pseudobacter ginsenosidimutans]RZS75482.1 subtilase family protein [Pseudobacter ginsenosidimutans]